MASALYGGLAEALTQLRDHAALARLAADLVGDLPGDPEVSYTAATYLARCAPLAHKDSGLARDYADRSLRRLREAVRQGYRNAARLKGDRSFDPLRGRPDFQQLSRDLEKQPAKER